LLMGSLSGYALAENGGNTPAELAPPVDGAPTAPAQPLTITPSQITIAGVGGTTESRTLLFRAETPIADLRVIPVDLYREDGNVVLPADALQVQILENAIPKDGFISAPLSLNLRDVASGEFKGQLLFTHQGGEISVPLTVKVKDHFGWPLAILIIGVGVGMGVSAYRSGGKPRDEAIVRIDRIDAQMESDRDLQKSPFQVDINAHLAVARSAFQNQKWTEIKDALDQAEAILLRWDKFKTDWIRQFQFLDELKSKVDDMVPNAEYKLTFQRDIEAHKSNAPEQENPDKLRIKLDELGKRINGYLRLEAQFKVFEKLWNRLKNEADREDWRTKLLALRQKLEKLPADLQTPADVDAVEKDIQDAITAIKEFEPRESRTERGGRGTPLSEAVESLSSEFVPLAPSARSFQKPKWWTFSNAQRRLKAFTWLTYALAVGFLAFAGFGELYLGDPIFGANFWGDYSALMAWGFGAEASRASITDMVKGWGISAN